VYMVTAVYLLSVVPTIILVSLIIITLKISVIMTVLPVSMVTSLWSFESVLGYCTVFISVTGI